MTIVNRKQLLHILPNPSKYIRKRRKTATFAPNKVPRLEATAISDDEYSDSDYVSDNDCDDDIMHGTLVETVSHRLS